MKSNKEILDELETGEIETIDGDTAIGVFKEDVLEAMKEAQVEVLKRLARDWTMQGRNLVAGGGSFKSVGIMVAELIKEIKTDKL